VRDIRHIEAAIGSGEKCIADAERPVRSRLGKSVVAAEHIAAGSTLQQDMLTAKSPGDGISPNHLAQLVGRVAAVDIEADALLPIEALDWEPSRDGVGSSA
jgi:sialic acid synthase SpsE